MVNKQELINGNAGDVEEGFDTVTPAPATNLSNVETKQQETSSNSQTQENFDNDDTG